MKTVDVVELNEKGVAVNDNGKNYFAEQGGYPDGNYFREDGEPTNIAGEWLVIDELLDIDNNYLTYAQLQDDEITLVKLPEKYVEKDYLIDYETDEECPVGVDVLVRENGFNVDIVPGCAYQGDANVSNHLDGHKYSGYLGFQLNDDYFVTYKKGGFKMLSL